MDHPNVVKLFEAFQDRNHVCLVMELCTGGDLLHAICQSQHFSETVAAKVTQQMLHAVSHVHGRGVVHRDLKTENFLLEGSGDVAAQTLKLTDFGLSCRFEPGQVLTPRVGTCGYLAPEVLNKSYGCP